MANPVATPPGLVLAGVLLPCTFVATALSFAGDAVPGVLPREILLGAGLLGGLVAVISATSSFVGKWRAHRTAKDLPTGVAQHSHIHDPAPYASPASQHPVPHVAPPPDSRPGGRKVSAVSPLWLGATAVFGLLSLVGAWPLFPVALFTGLLAFRKHAAAAGVALALAVVVVLLAGFTLLYLSVESVDSSTPFDCAPQGYATSCS